MDHYFLGVRETILSALEWHRARTCKSKHEIRFFGLGPLNKNALREHACNFSVLVLLCFCACFVFYIYFYNCIILIKNLELIWVYVHSNIRSWNNESVQSTLGSMIQDKAVKWLSSYIFTLLVSLLNFFHLSKKNLSKTVSVLSQRNISWERGTSILVKDGIFFQMKYRDLIKQCFIPVSNAQAFKKYAYDQRTNNPNLFAQTKPSENIQNKPIFISSRTLCKELNTRLLVFFVFALWDFCKLVRRACGIYFSVLVEQFIAIYSLVSKGRISLFGSVFFCSLAISKRSFFALRQPYFTLLFVAAPVQFFPSSQQM